MDEKMTSTNPRTPPVDPKLTDQKPFIFDIHQGSRLRAFSRGKTRIWLAWVFAVVLLVYARNMPDRTSAWIGSSICFIGATIRFWASAFLRKDSSMAVGGPYSFVRNPLYFGTYLMGIGCAWMVGGWILSLILSILFGGIYYFTITDEETKLKEIFGEPYLNYLRHVPRFIPRLLPASRAALAHTNSNPNAFVFDGALLMRNKGLEPYYSFAALMGLIYLVPFLWHGLLNLLH